MAINCADIVSKYIETLEREFQVEDHPSGCVIVAPFVRPDGDYIEILAEAAANGDLTLTDMGDTLAYLHTSGMSLSRRFMEDVRRISQRFGAAININEIVIQSNLDTLEASLHDLIQACLNVAALIEKRRPYTNLRFEDEVEAEIIAHGRTYDYQYQVTGAREPHTVRFHINSGLNLLIQPFSQATEAAAKANFERWYYRFSDILAANPSWRIYAILDDRGSRQSIWLNPSTTLPLRDVVTLVKWSEKEGFTSILA